MKNLLTRTLALLGLPVLLATTASGALYTQNFDAFPDGTTDLADGTVMAGNTTIVGGQLQLTQDGGASGFSSFSIPALVDSSLRWTATFDLTISDGAGNNEPADGFSFNYGNAPLGELGSAEEGMVNQGAVTENISFEIDTWMNLDAEQGVNIAEKVAGVDMNLAFTNGSILSDGTSVSGEVVMTFDPVDGLSFSTTGLITNANFANVASTFIGDDDYTFIFSGRVGGANQTVLIDNLEIQTGAGTDSDGDGLPDDYEVANMLDPNDNGLNPNNNGAVGDPDNGAAGDPDMDGSPNTEERDRGTDPQDDDTDDDGYVDGVEDGSGTWTDATATGTRPTDPDSDDDGLEDGVENPDLPSVDADQTGTDPNVVDSDGDGMEDGYEIANGLDPDDNGLNPNNNGIAGNPNNGAAGDPDMDTLTNAQELALGTNPADDDTDGDALRDDVETNTRVWVSLTNTGTDPNSDDTDGDTLLDNIENPDLPFVDINQPGTDPNFPDTDDDTVSDSAEIAAGRNPTVPQLPLVGYVQNFDRFTNGDTDLGDGTVMNGTANIQDGQLELTRDSVAGGFASFMIPAIAGSENGWTATFDLTIFDSPANNAPADGMSFNYGNFGLTELGAAEEGMGTIAGVSENISFEIDTWENPDAEQGVNIAEKVAGTDSDLEFTNGVILEDGTEVSGPVSIVYDPVDGLSFTTNGLVTNAAFEDIATSFVGDAAYNFGFSARVGGANETLLIDNLYLEIGGGTPLEIIDIQYTIDPADGLADVSVTWTSKPGRTYILYASETADGPFLGDLDDGISSGGDTTTFVDMDIPANITTRLYRVQEEQ